MTCARNAIPDALKRCEEPMLRQLVYGETLMRKRRRELAWIQARTIVHNRSKRVDQISLRSKPKHIRSACGFSRTESAVSPSADCTGCAAGTWGVKQSAVITSTIHPAFHYESANASFEHLQTITSWQAVHHGRLLRNKRSITLSPGGVAPVAAMRMVVDPNRSRACGPEEMEHISCLNLRVFLSLGQQLAGHIVDRL